MASNPHIAVVGLGYVGLPLAVHLAKRFQVTGFDIDRDRIRSLSAGDDATGEIARDALKSVTIAYTDDERRLGGADIYIVTVPTPVDSANKPDLAPVRSACAVVGRHMGKGAIVVFECTVYPGVTEDICGPALEAASGLSCGTDFFLGYSPERINPGDREHTVDRITKVVAGQTPEVTQRLAEIYGALTGGKIFIAANIRTAEAAKVIENSQRDLNIAFINEVTMIFQRIGLSVHDVLAAARTKWNFLDFKPGLVGGHCIGVDPFYLAECAEKAGHHPEIILAGRRINDTMGGFLAAAIDEALARPAARILVLGLTFKENVADLRNSKVANMIEALQSRGHQVEVHDPLADPTQAKRVYGLSLVGDLKSLGRVDAVVGAVSHRFYTDFSADDLAVLVKPDGLVADIKNMWGALQLPSGLRRWGL
jgi:UDP-N-acetyl-D-galactosamine dehydrogenase